jgi:putrescine aminotransferase
VAIANLKLLRDEKIVGRVKSDTGPYFQKKLRDTFANHPIIGDISGVGLVAGLQLAQEPKTRKHFANGGEVGTICRDFCFNGNLIMRATGDRMLLSPPFAKCLRVFGSCASCRPATSPTPELSPPLVITKQEIDEIVSKAKKAIDATAQQLGIS